MATAFAERDVEAFSRHLAEEVRWRDDNAPNKCHTRREVLATFQRLLAEGAGGEVTATKIGRAGVRCPLRIHWPDPANSEQRGEVLHLWVRDREIVAPRHRISGQEGPIQDVMKRIWVA
jgi:hypothetical protein